MVTRATDSSIALGSRMAPWGTMFSGHGTVFTSFGSRRVPSGISSAATTTSTVGVAGCFADSISLRSACSCRYTRAAPNAPSTIASSSSVPGLLMVHTSRRASSFYHLAHLAHPPPPPRLRVVGVLAAIPQHGVERGVLRSLPFLGVPLRLLDRLVAM